jgi:RNA polymerase sigma-32 factor
MPDAPRQRRKPSAPGASGTTAADHAAGKAPARSKTPRPAATKRAAATKPSPRPAAREPDEAVEDKAAGSDEASDEGLDVEALGSGEAAVLLDDEAESDGATTAIVPASGRALAPGDSEARDLLQRYMAEVSRYPLLSRDEELRISREYVRTQDPKLAYRLVTANLRLVVKIAWEYRRAAFNILDLIQEGNVGLMQAVRKFDPERSVKLSSYAAWWIRAYLIRYLMDNWRMVKLGTTQAQRKIFFNLRKEKDRLAAEGFEPTSRLLAERLDVPEQDVVDMDVRMNGGELSIDAPVGDDGQSTIADRLAEGGPGIDDTLGEREIADVFKRELAFFARDLKDKERYLFEHRLVADEPMTLQEVGDHYGISRERARQIEAKLVARLKDHMRRHLPDFAKLSLEAPEDD